MSYAIVRNEKLTRAEAQGRCVHNDRRAKNHTNKDIDSERTILNYYLKENKQNYVKEFDKIRKENNLQGMIRSNSIIICEMLFTSDKEFFDKIGEEETKRYFNESYRFISNYKRSNFSEDSTKLVTEANQEECSCNKPLGEKNIVSAVVHLDEGVPHMHLAYIPVVHTEDKEGNRIEKICAKDFWKGRDSYRIFQNEFYNYITEKGFELKRGMPVEETGAKNLRIEELKQITNYEKTKQVLNEVYYELPKVPELSDIKKVMLNRDEKIYEEIIKPKDELINELFDDNTKLRVELSKQVRLVNKAEKYQNEKEGILAENSTLRKEVNETYQEYAIKTKNLEAEYKELKNDLKEDYEKKAKKIENKYEDKIYELEKENGHLHKIIDTLEKTIHKFIKWICSKFDLGAEDDVVRDFEKETKTFIEPEKQIRHERKERELDMEM